MWPVLLLPPPVAAAGGGGKVPINRVAEAGWWEVNPESGFGTFSSLPR